MSIAQDEVEVKECELEECHEPAYREGLCWEHFIQEKLAEWDNQDAERQACWAGVGYR